MTDATAPLTFTHDNPLTDEARAAILSGSHDMPTMMSKDHCPQCDATERAFNKKGLVAGVDYRVVKIDTPVHEDMFEHAKNTLGAAGAPVMVFQGESFAGFRPDKLKNLIIKVSEAQLAAA